MPQHSRRAAEGVQGHVGRLRIQHAVQLRSASIHLRGHGRASELLFFGRSMSAEEGLAWGFFNALHPPEALAGAAAALARELAEGPSFAHVMTKRMLQMEWAMSVEQAIEAEAVAQALCMTTGDFRRAYEGFVTRRRPEFKGD
ncbi:MAG: enoyl-CoA hydratase-related protein [Paracraurococcus sp.]